MLDSRNGAGRPHDEDVYCQIMPSFNGLSLSAVLDRLEPDIDHT